MRFAPSKTGDAVADDIRTSARGVEQTRTTPISEPFWTPEYLDFIRPLRAEDVLGEGGGRSDPAKREEWRWISFAHRMEHLYGTNEAVRRLNEQGERQPPGWF